MLKRFLVFIATFLWLYSALFANEVLGHMVILGDPHLPGKNPSHKEAILETLNTWSNVDMVVAVGDICEHRATYEEYQYVKTYFDKLHKPLFVINGNHDYIYDDVLNEEGKLQKASSDIQQAKLQTFQRTFANPSLYYSMQKYGYFFLFLAADSPKHLTHISSKQLQWAQQELNSHKNLPTIVFFHAPLEKTLHNYRHFINTPNFVAQPIEPIKEMLQQHPQLFLWVSGHTHTPPSEESFASSINLYEQRVTNLHNTDMNKETIWTNSLFFYPDKVIIKTFDHTQQTWLPKLQRTILLPTI